MVFVIISDRNEKFHVIRNSDIGPKMQDSISWGEIVCHISKEQGQLLVTDKYL